MANILLILERSELPGLAGRLHHDGHTVWRAYTVTQGLEMAQSLELDACVLDMDLGGALEGISGLHLVDRAPRIITLGPSYDPTGTSPLGAPFAEGLAGQLARSGVFCAREKPADEAAIVACIEGAIAEGAQEPEGETDAILRGDAIVGHSAALRASLDLAARAASSEASALITGETGTGKELLASAIHQASRRADGPFVVVDCAALPPTLVESVLFGHTRGAFTGANEAATGLVRQAHKGTLFLDEVGELPMAIQRSFLRVLQERRFRPVGSAEEVESDFRLLAATNQDLDAMVASGQFRSDMLFRLRTIHIELPPLRRRLEDIPEIAAHHLQQLRAKHVRGGGTQPPPQEFSPDFLRALAAYDWPGNVRELVNTLEMSMLGAGTSRSILVRHLPEALRAAALQGTLREEANPATPTSAFPTFKAFRTQEVSRVERTYLERLRTYTDGDPAHAREVAGLSKSRFYELLRKHRLDFSPTE